MLRPLVGSIRSFSQAATAGVAQPLKYSYYVARNSNGNLPVYTDIRNAGSRFLVQIRNVDGNVNALTKELEKSLFKPNSPEARRMKIRSNHQHVIISGGRWKQQVVEWLKAQGF